MSPGWQGGRLPVAAPDPLKAVVVLGRYHWVSLEAKPSTAPGQVSRIRVTVEPSGGAIGFDIFPHNVGDFIGELRRLAAVLGVRP